MGSLTQKCCSKLLWKTKENIQTTVWTKKAVVFFKTSTLMFHRINKESHMGLERHE